MVATRPVLKGLKERSELTSVLLTPMSVGKVTFSGSWPLLRVCPGYQAASLVLVCGGRRVRTGPALTELIFLW